MTLDDLRKNLPVFTDVSQRLFMKDLFDYLSELEKRIPNLEPPQLKDTGELKCPECGGAMASRTGQYGRFWGCKNYPQCKGTRDSMGRSKLERHEQNYKKDHENIGPDSKRWTVPSDDKRESSRWNQDNNDEYRWDRK